MDHFKWFDKEKYILESKRIIKDNVEVHIARDDFVSGFNNFS